MESYGAYIVENVKLSPLLTTELLLVQRPCLFHQDIGSFKRQLLVFSISSRE